MALIHESITQKEAAIRLRLSTAQVRELTQRGILSRNLDRSYPWPKIADEHQAFRDATRPAAARQSEPDVLEQERIRLTRAKANAAELEYRRQRREVMEIPDGEARLRAALERVNAVLKQAPSKYGTKLARRSKIRLPEARALLSEIIESVRSELRELGDSDASAA